MSRHIHLLKGNIKSSTCAHCKTITIYAMKTMADQCQSLKILVNLTVLPQFLLYFQ